MHSQLILLTPDKLAYIHKAFTGEEAKFVTVQEDGHLQAKVLAALAALGGVL